MEYLVSQCGYHLRKGRGACVKNWVECILHSIAQDSSSKVSKGKQSGKDQNRQIRSKTWILLEEKKISKINSAGAFFFTLTFYKINFKREHYRDLNRWTWLIKPEYSSQVPTRTWVYMIFRPCLCYVSSVSLSSPLPFPVVRLRGVHKTVLCFDSVRSCQ